MFNTLLLFIPLVETVLGFKSVLCYQYRGKHSKMFNGFDRCRGTHCIIASSGDFVVEDCTPFCSDGAKQSVDLLLNYQIHAAGLDPRDFHKNIRCCQRDLCNRHDYDPYKPEKKNQCYKYDGLKSEMKEKATKCSGDSCVSVTTKGYISTGCTECRELTTEIQEEAAKQFKEKFGVTIVQNDVAIHCCTDNLCNGAHKYENGGIDGNDGITKEELQCYAYAGLKSQMMGKATKCSGKNACVTVTAQDFMNTRCMDCYKIKPEVRQLAVEKFKEHFGMTFKKDDVAVECCSSNLCNAVYEKEIILECYSHSGLKSEMLKNAKKCSSSSCMSVTTKDYIFSSCDECYGPTEEVKENTVARLKREFGVTVKEEDVDASCCIENLCNGVGENGDIGGNGGSDVVVPLEKPERGVECYSFGGLKSQMMGNATKCSDKTACVTAFALDYMFTHCIDCYEVSPNVRKSAVEAFREDYGVVVKEEDVEIECCSSNLCNAVYEKEIILECYSYSGLKSEMMKNAKKCSSSSCMSVTAGDYIFSFCDECYGPTEEVRKNNVARLKKEFNVTIKEEDVDASCCIENLCNGVGVEENDLIVKGGNSLFSLPSVSLSFWTVLIYSNQ